MELCELLPKQGVSSIGIVPQPALKHSPGEAGCERSERGTGIEHTTDINAKSLGR